MWWSDYTFDRNHVNSVTADAGVEYYKFQLAKSVFYNDIPQLQRLFDEDRARISVVDRGGNTLLHYAVACDRLEVLKFLLDVEGSSIDSEETIRGRTPLITALVDGKESSVMLLLKRGANINLVDLFHRSPLHHAVENMSLEVSRFLIERGADVNLRDNTGITCLHIACWRKWVEGVCMLLYYGADVTIPNSTAGLTPFDTASDELREILFDYVFDDDKVPLNLFCFLNLMSTDSPLFPKILDNVSEVLCSEGYIPNLGITTLNPIYFRLFMEKFDYAVEKVIKSRNIFEDIPRELSIRAIENWEIILDSRLAQLLVKRINKQYTDEDEHRPFVLNDVIKRVRRVLPSQESKLLLLISKMLKLGLRITDRNVSTVFLNYGYSPLFKEMISLNVGKSGKKVHLMPLLIYDVTATIEGFLAKPKNYSTKALDLVLEQFCHSEFKEFCLRLGKFEEKVNKLPQVPLLTELSRNVVRKYIIDMYKVKKFCHFCRVLEKLPIGKQHEQILTYEKKLYV